MYAGRVNGPAASFGPTDDIVPAIMPRGAGTFSEKSAVFAEMIEAYFPSLQKIEINYQGRPRGRVGTLEDFAQRLTSTPAVFGVRTI